MSLLKWFIRGALISFYVGFAHAQVVGLATNPQGSSYYSVGAAIAQLLQVKAGLNARVQPMSGSSAYTPLINRGEIEFGLLNSLDVVNAYLGVDNFKRGKNSELRLIGAMFIFPNGIAVPNDSPVKSIKDLKGLTMPSSFTSQSTMLTQQDAMLATGGLSTMNMKPFPVSGYNQGMAALAEGKVDAAMVCLQCGAGLEAHVALAARGGLRFLPIADTPEALAAMKKQFPSSFTLVYQPSAAYPGLVGPTRLMTFSAFLLTSTHVSDEVAYITTKAIYENKPMLAAASVQLQAFDPTMMNEDNTVPYHPGAEKYYKEIGQWPPKKR